MRAAEKLKALLDAAAREEAGIVPVNPEDLGYVQYNKSQAALEDALADALPQIVAVLEEAERAATRRRGFLENDDLRASLAALDEALS